MCKAHFCSSWSFRRRIFSNTDEIDFPTVCCGLKEAFGVSDTKQIRVRYRHFKCISNYHNLKEYLAKRGNTETDNRENLVKVVGIQHVSPQGQTSFSANKIDTHVEIIYESRPI